MTEKPVKPASKLSYTKVNSQVDDRGHGSNSYLSLEAESQTDAGAWDLFKKLKKEMGSDASGGEN